jgi:hypothetical protein
MTKVLIDGECLFSSRLAYSFCIYSNSNYLSVCILLLFTTGHTKIHYFGSLSASDKTLLALRSLCITVSVDDPKSCQPI